VHKGSYQSITTYNAQAACTAKFPKSWYNNKSRNNLILAMSVASYKQLRDGFGQ
jgi:hypothetical protein